MPLSYPLILASFVLGDQALPWRVYAWPQALPEAAQEEEYGVEADISIVEFIEIWGGCPSTKDCPEQAHPRVRHLFFAQSVVYGEVDG